jgi:pheromone shutdown protein TraB
MTETLFLAGNIIMFVGTSLLICTVWRNRTLLQGYDLFGAILTLVGLLLFYAAFLASGQWLSCVFATITVCYWAFVVAFKVRAG